MDREIYIGDKVKTKNGIGFVQDARSWREAIEELDDNSARLFSEKCKSEVGNNYMNDWVEILVNIDGVNHIFLSIDVEILEGR